MNAQADDSMTAVDICHALNVGKDSQTVTRIIKTRLPIAAYRQEKKKPYGKIQQTPLYDRAQAEQLIDSLQRFSLLMARAWLKRPYNDDTDEEPDMDDADLSERHTEILAKANAYRSKKPEPEGAPSGHCWQCGEPIGHGRRWCNADCRDDWQAENE